MVEKKIFEKKKIEKSTKVEKQDFVKKLQVNVNSTDMEEPKSIS